MLGGKSCLSQVIKLLISKGFILGQNKTYLANLSNYLYNCNLYFQHKYYNTDLPPGVNTDRIKVISSFGEKSSVKKW